MDRQLLPENLRRHLISRQCVAFVGAGFSIPCDMPTWNALVTALLDEAHKGVVSSDQRELLEDSRQAAAAGLYSTAATGVRRLLTSQEMRHVLADAFSSAKLDRLSPAQKERMLARMSNLVRAPWAGIITTNFDGLIGVAFDRFSNADQPFRCNGDEATLGNVLCLPYEVGKFYVTLHGTTWAEGQILSTADYIRHWISSSRVVSFLTAVMLRYRVVFIGCSLEDVVVQLRQRLVAEFHAGIPQAYALMPDTVQNRIRRRELRDLAGIETISYAGVSPEDHTAVDRFLELTRSLADISLGSPSALSMTSLARLTPADRLCEVGQINISLLRLILTQPRERLKYEDILQPQFEMLPPNSARTVLARVSEGERLYRLLFLVSIGLVKEVEESGRRFFALVDGVDQEALRERV